MSDTSAATPSFRQLLSQKTDEVERPRALAEGHYIGIIRAHEFGVTRQKNTDFVRFLIVPQEEASDVPDGANAGMDITRRELRKDFFITPSALYRLSDMLDAVLGKQIGRSFDQRITETRGLRVMFSVSHRKQLDDAGNVTNTFEDIGTIIAA